MILCRTTTEQQVGLCWNILDQSWGYVVGCADAHFTPMKIEADSQAPQLLSVHQLFCMMLSNNDNDCSTQQVSKEPLEILEIHGYKCKASCWCAEWLKPSCGLVFSGSALSSVCWSMFCHCLMCDDETCTIYPDLTNQSTNRSTCQSLDKLGPPLRSTWLALN